MSTNYKFTYFNLKGLGEGVRFLFYYGNLNFDDIRVEIKDWMQLKPSVYFGQLPLLEVDGKVFNQSTAICRYLGKQLELNGKNDLEELEIDSVVETFIDFKNKVQAWSKASDDIKEEKRDEIFAQVVDFYFSKFEEIIENNGGHLACGRLTWADFYVAGAMDYVIYMLDKNVINQYPNFKSLIETIYNQPAIKSWIERRPATLF